MRCQNPMTQPAESLKVPFRCVQSMSTTGGAVIAAPIGLQPGGFQHHLSTRTRP
ncbi:hypothetical protein I547_6750 [Mycobacterium kansasii 824]|uniref:Uncharacterized protein n=1 Tax=Mycobacterium kansasii TaxID=1768 RepID=A0A1V3X6B2_MYCKA|nr:hypothetical protein I547_6750 [Mycobacterium kansasii 824]OOK74773.1 hypothetical protein BZL29_4562 [Mycobacterium kansasii]